jgi:CheY-like chemotaxis protein
MDGIVFIHYVKFKYPHIKVLICSGSVRTSDLMDLLEGRLMDAYVRKPIKEKEYAGKIRAVFESQKVVRLSFPG